MLRDPYISASCQEQQPQEEYKEQGQHTESSPGLQQFVGQGLPQNTAFGFQCLLDLYSMNVFSLS